MSLRFFLFCLFVLCTSLLHAGVEINIEGKNGWAAKLPTRKFENKVTKALFGVPITMYHLLMVLSMLVVAHLPLFFTRSWTLYHELFIIGFILIHFTLEDFFWFVFNPAFGLERFSPKYIWWHTRWLWKAPLLYWIIFPLGIICLAVSGLLA